MKKLRFRNQEFLLIASDGGVGGAIATEAQYTNGEPSFAHLMPDGTIMRFGNQIGTTADIQWIGEQPDPIPTDHGILSILTLLAGGK